MKGAIIDKGEQYFTFFKGLFQEIGNIQKDYNWLITGHECYPEDACYTDKLSKEWCWMTGEELTRMVENEDFQWIWGVLSAFPKDITEEEVLGYGFPVADGNEKIWQSPISMQHPLAVMEIIAWDSLLTILISKDECVVERLMQNNLFAKDLDEYINHVV